MSRTIRYFSLASVLAAGLSLVLAWPTSGNAEMQLDRPLPAFTHTDAASWLNSPPLSVADLRGQVVLLDVWTFGCWNCTGSIPWLQKVEKTFAGQPFRIVGIHTPEFSNERDPRQVAAHVRSLGVEGAVMMDNDQAYWKALENQYWPAFYVVDKKGRMRALYVGETHAGQAQAQEIETRIRMLLAEPG